jgi:hypothetical protein
MNSNLDKIAQDLYGKIQTRFKDITIGDEHAQTLSRKEDIPKARFFEFEYVENGESLGTITITLDEDDGIVIEVGGDLVNDDDETTHHGAYEFIRSFRQFAKKRLLKFDADNIGKSNLDKRDYQFKAKRREEPVMPMQPVMENKMYGTNKISYQDLGESARLVIKHSQPVNLDVAAGRTMHIESIYIENADGERFKYPYKHLSGARALAEHIKHGGNPYDAIGKHVIGLSEELAGLRKFKGYVSRQSQVSEAMGNVTDRVLERIEQIKETIAKLQRPAYYQEFAESFEEQEEYIIPEEIQNDLINRLTIRTFNEDLKSVFPYIAKFVNEDELDVVELGADDLLAEGPNNDALVDQVNTLKQTNPQFAAEVQAKNLALVRGMGLEAQKHNAQVIQQLKILVQKYSNPTEKIVDPAAQFESFLNDIVREDKDELFSPNKDAKLRAIDQLNQIFAKELPGGPGGVNAIESLKGLIDDPELFDVIRDLDPNLDTRPVIQQWLHDNLNLFAGDGAETLAMIHFAGPEGDGIAEPAPEEAPVAPPPEAAPAPEAGAVPPAPPAGEIPPAPEAAPAAPAAPAPMAESIVRALKKAQKAGATLETALDFGHGVKTIAEIIDECGCTPEDVGFEQPQESGLPAMLKYLSGFYNKEAGNFPMGGTRMKIKVKKAWEDGEFGEASEQDVANVFRLIDKKDPSGQPAEHNPEQMHVIKLAGVQPKHSTGMTTDHLDQEMHSINPADMMKAIMHKLKF